MRDIKNSRRSFLQRSAVGAAAVLTIPSWLTAKGGEVNREIADQDAIKLGIAGYSFLNFDLQASLVMMKRMDVKYLCIKDFHLPLDSSAEQITAFHKKLAEFNVKGYAVGPLYMKTKEEIDKAFDYCKKVGVDLMIGIPEIKDLPYVAQKAKEYNIKYGIHNHGPEDKIYPNATVIWNHIKDLDKNLGMCFDMGHDTRDGQDPIKDLQKYKNRIFDIHLKNVQPVN